MYLHVDITHVSIRLQIGRYMTDFTVSLNQQKTLKLMPGKTKVIFRTFDDLLICLHQRKFSACLDLGGADVIFAQN